jgi:hypothetical protein
MRNVAEQETTAATIDRTTSSLLFPRVALLCAVICLALSIVWIAVPQLLLDLWQVKFTYESGLVGRRAGALFLGAGVAFFAARRAWPSPLRSALLWSACLSCVTLALLGIVEFATAHAGSRILWAVAVELLMAAALAWASREGSDRELDEPLT